MILSLFSAFALAASAEENVPASVFVGDVELGSGMYLPVGETTPVEDAPEKGYAYYDYGTLVLKNFTLSGLGKEAHSTDHALITATGDLTILVIGENRLEAEEMGIYVEQGALNIKFDNNSQKEGFSLDIISGSVGICAYQSDGVTIGYCDLYIEAEDSAIEANGGDTIIQYGRVEAIAKNGAALSKAPLMATYSEKGLITASVNSDGSESETFSKGNSEELDAFKAAATTFKYFKIAETVDVNLFDGGENYAEPIRVEIIDQYTLPECPFEAPEGKQFKAWKYNGQEYAVGDKITLSDDVDIAAVWQDKAPEQCIIGYYPPDGLDSYGLDYAEYGKEYTVLDIDEADIPDGYVFIGWKLKDTDQIFEAGDTIIPTEEYTIFYAVFEEIPTLGFGVSVGGTMIDEDNYMDVFGDGKVSFDPETGTLTLNGFNYKGEGDKGAILGAGIGIVSMESLIVELVGENSLFVEGDNTYGIAVKQGDVTVKGSGSLDIDASCVGIMSGINGSVIIESGDITIDVKETADSDIPYAIGAYNFFVMKGGSINISSTSFGILIMNGVENSIIAGGNLTVSVGQAGGLFLGIYGDADEIVPMPVISTAEGAVITASAIFDGTDAEEYNAENFMNYTYLSVISPESDIPEESTEAETVEITETAGTETDSEAESEADTESEAETDDEIASDSQPDESESVEGTVAKDDTTASPETDGSTEETDSTSAEGTQATEEAGCGGGCKSSLGAGVAVIAVVVGLAFRTVFKKKED